MPSKTPTGLPYPLATEPTRDGAANIQALAVALDVRVQAGTAVISTNVTGDGYVPYPVAFKAGTKPYVVVVMSDPPSGYIASSFQQYTDNTRAAVRVTTLAGAVVNGNIRVEWIAIGVVT